MVSRAGRSEFKTIIKALLTYSLLLIIAYTIVSSSLTIPHYTYVFVSSLDSTIISAFMVFFIVLMLRIVMATQFTNYLLITSLTLLGTSLLINEYIVIHQRNLNVYILPLMNILIHGNYAVLSIDLGQLFLLTTLILIATKVIHTKNTIKKRIGREKKS